jgi:hypothetical protein
MPDPARLDQPSDASSASEPFESMSESPRSSARTSDSRNRRWPPGVRILPIRPDAAQRVTVFGSTRNRLATSPGVRRRSRFSTSSPFLGHGGLANTRMAVDVNSTVVWSCPSWTPMRCVHAVVPLRLPLTRDCCAAFKKVGVVVTRSTRCVTKKRQPGICASFGSRVGHVVLSDVASSRRPMGPSRQRRQRSCMLGKSGLRAGVIRFTATRRDGTQDLKRKT